jgi:hypothetical protein
VAPHLRALAGRQALDAAVHTPQDERDEDGGNDGSGQHGDFLDVESAIVIQPGVGKLPCVLMF